MTLWMPYGSTNILICIRNNNNHKEHTTVSIFVQLKCLTRDRHSGGSEVSHLLTQQTLTGRPQWRGEVDRHFRERLI